MKTNLSRVLTLFLVLVAQISFAQQKSITGTVSDESGVLPGVSVSLKGGTSGAETDFDGKYIIKSNVGEILVFRYLGYKTVEKTVGTSNTISVNLLVDANLLDEIVVTGTGAGINKKRLSITVDVITSKDIERTPTRQLDQLLQASAPSAQIKLSSGQPGTNSIIRTRGPLSANGNTTPVIIVDGIRVDNLNSNASLGLATGGANSSSIADIPLESIEKIEYVKGGAATTLYGADAANGVIQIITKKGTIGKTRINFEVETGIISGTEDFLRFKKTGDLLFTNGTFQNYRIGFNGGTEKFRYNIAGSMYADDGFNTVNEQYKRNIRAGFTAKINDKLTYQGSSVFSTFNFTRDYNANSGFSRFSNSEGGDFGDVDALSDNDFNDLKVQNQLEGDLTDITDRIRRFQISNKFTYKIDEDFQVNLIFGLDSRNNRQEVIETNELQISKDRLTPGTTDQGSISRFTRNFITFTGELNAQHKFTLKENFSFITTVGGQFFRNDDFQQRIIAEGVADGAITVNGAEYSVNDFQRGFSNFGVYISENIGLWDKIFFDLGLRIDGNTAFGDEIGLLYLPKIGVNYNVSDEEFWKNTFTNNTLSSLKLRANWGQATNFPTPFAGDLTVAANNFLGQQAFTFSNPGNTNLTSETVTTIEFGIDLGLFDDRIRLSGTYYDGVTEDALFTPPQSPSSGQLNQLKNIGEISNKGYELSLQATVLNKEKHNLQVNVSYNYNENLVVSSGGAPEFNVGGFTFLGAFVKEGEPLGFLRGASSTVDENGVATINRNVNIGNTFSPNFGSFSLYYTYDNKLSFFLNGDYQSGGQAVAVDDVLRFFGGLEDEGRFPQEVLDYNAVAGQSLSFFDLASYWVEDSDFLKIRNIGSTYNLGKISKSIDNLTIGVNVTNPFNFVTASFDPEASGSGFGAQGGFSGGGFGYGTESAPRIYTLSIKVKL
jgi:outer membrane receptor protein involved in Fe transport